MSGSFANSSETIGPKGLKNTVFNAHTVIRKFDEDQSKILPVGLFSPQKCPGYGRNSMPQ